MYITLNEILKKNIFEECQILSGTNNLDHIVTSVSYMEVPDYQNYIIENSIILTTLFPIYHDENLIKALIPKLKENKAVALVVKIKRYVDTIPEEVINIATELNFPVIQLPYDANLSVISNEIISEILSTSNLDTDISYLSNNLFMLIYENPSFETFVDSLKKYNMFDLLILENSSQTVVHSSQKIYSFYEKCAHIKNQIVFSFENNIIHKKEVIFDNDKVYTLFLSIDYPQRHLARSYIELCSFILIFILQKQKETLLMQNNLLSSFVSSILRNSNLTNSKLSELSKFYNWQIKFPLSMIVVSSKNNDTKTFYQFTNQNMSIFPNITIDIFRCNSNDIKVFNYNNQILMLININNKSLYFDKMKILAQKIFDLSNNLELSISISNLINDASNIPQTYTNLIESIDFDMKFSTGNSILFEKDFDLLNLFKSVEQDKLYSFVQRHLQTVIDYDKQNDTQLLHTMLTFIKCRFNIKLTSEKLFIHYNTLRYRLATLEKLGYTINNENYDYQNLLFALTIYFFFYYGNI